MEKESVKILTEEEIIENLKNFPGWEQKGDKISKEFKFEDFMDAISFINELAPFCEKMDHHPDIRISYSKVLFELQRFDVGGKITDRDFVLAGEIERLFKER